MPNPVTDWLIFIGGFMQDRAQAVYGICGMAHEARDRYARAGVLVDYEPWKSDWRATAEWIYRWSMAGNGIQEPPTIMIVAYSWGAGWGFIELAEHLADRELTVNCAVVSDAVRHVGWDWCHRFGVSQVCAYWPYWKIEKPENVERFDWFVQGRKRRIKTLIRDRMRGATWLYGHEWIDSAGQPAGNKHQVPLAVHTNMDDARAFRECVFNRANELFLRRAA